MTQPPDDDRDLIHFLHRYRPNPPPAHPDLEDQILSSLPRRSRRNWIIPSALAASLVGAIALHNALQPQITVNTAEIEDYMETNWSSTVHSTSDPSNTATSSEDLAYVDFTE